MSDQLTHFNEQGRARMVDVSSKSVTTREAVAVGVIWMRAETLLAIRQGQVVKGDVLAVAQVAGIMAAKRTGELIPMCHPLPLTGVDIEFRLTEAPMAAVHILAVAKTVGVTGVEMEALTAVSTAALTIYDMCKAMDKGMTIGEIQLLKKSGGKSGDYRREGMSIWQDRL